MQPYIVSEVLDGDGNVVQKNEPTVIRQAISEETSEIMRQMILSVVTEGTAKKRPGRRLLHRRKNGYFRENWRI